MNYEIKDVRWFGGWLTGRGGIGIVQVEDPYDGLKYYIGNGCRGESERADMEHIAAWGNSFPTDAGDVLFGVKQ